jgi:hypothetical protein
VIQVIDPGPPLHSFRAPSGVQHIGGPVEHVDTAKYLFLVFKKKKILTNSLQGYENT